MDILPKRKEDIVRELCLKKVMEYIGLGCTFLAVFIMACSDSIKPDSTPPAAVLNLAIVDSNAGSVTLQWTATGDDSLTGTAAVYDIRFSTAMLSESNWNSATKVVGEPKPQAPGTIETIEITGLAADSLYYFAIKVQDDSYNWSEISNVVSANPDLKVEFPDGVLDSVIRNLIDKPDGEIRASQLLTIDSLDASALQIGDISGLEYCSNIQYLRLQSNQIVDIGPLANLIHLEWLSLYANQISDISPLADITSLELLFLGDNQIEDIAALANKPNLRELALDGNQISDIGPLANLTAIQSILLSGNNIADIGPLVDNEGLGHGDELWLEDNLLNEQAITEHIPALQERGVYVFY